MRFPFLKEFAPGFGIDKADDAIAGAVGAVEEAADAAVIRMRGAGLIAGFLFAGAGHINRPFSP
jgi:hypothetical protein